MTELERKKRILEAIREAIANINLESDYNVSLDKEIMENICNKVMKLGGIHEKMGRLYL